MISIAIINLKGGVGKSVTACNLAAELAAKSKSVLVVDLDKQGNTSKFFGCPRLRQPQRWPRLCWASASTSWRPLSKGVDVCRAYICCPAICGCSKANRTILMDTTEPAAVPSAGRAEMCGRGLRLLPAWTARRTLDMGSINALCAADWVIIPVDCDEWACDGMQEISRADRAACRPTTTRA